MVDFSNIQAQAVTAETKREYTFFKLVGEPSLLVAPMHNSNPAYLNESLRLATERAAEIAAGPKGKVSNEVSVESMKKTMEDDREYDRQLLSSVCVVGWGASPPVAVEGEVEFSRANAMAFIYALPTEHLDPLRSWAANIYNFIDTPRRADPARDAHAGE